MDENLLPEGLSNIRRYPSQSSLDECSQLQVSILDDVQHSPYKNRHHADKVLEVMNSMRKDDILCDVTLVAEDRTFRAHRIVLSGASPYFSAMFSENFEEKTQQRVVLNEVDAVALEYLIDYMYTTEIFITTENVQKILVSANMLHLPDVREACCSFLERQLHPSNCIGISLFADIQHCPNLYAQAEAFLLEHFMEVIEYEEFLQLSPNSLINLISSDKLIVPLEEEVFESVVNWVNYDKEERLNHLPTLMEHVRLPLCTKDFILQKVDNEPLLKADLHCKDYVIEAMKYHLLRNDQKQLMKTIRTTPRQANYPRVLIVIGGQAPKAIRSVECYDLEMQTWRMLSDMPSRRCRAGVVQLNGKVYAVGGFNGSLRVKTVDVYDVATDQWSNGIPMLARRSTLGVAVLCGKIYAVGGFDGSNGLDTAEAYDPRLRQWTMVAPMSIRRSSVGVGVLNNVLYAVGGYDGGARQCLSSVECYSAHTNSWSPIAEMNSKRSGAGVGALDGLLYAVGGHDGPVILNTVEVYNPITGTWRNVADMTHSRRNSGVVSHNGYLYVVGGDDGNASLSSVEVYSPHTNTWTALPQNMNIGRSYAGLALTERPPTSE